MNVCALPEHASAHKSSLSPCILSSCVDRQIASTVGFRARETCTTRLPAFQRLVYVPTHGAIPLALFRPFSATRALPAVVVKAFPARALAAIYFTVTSPAVRPRAEIWIARRHHDLCGEGIVDTRELARKLIPKLDLAESKPAIGSTPSAAFPGGPGLGKQRRMNFFENKV